SSDVCSSDLFLFFLISHFFTYFLHRANYVFSFDKDIIFFILSASSFLDSFLSWRACSSFLISRCIFSSVDKVTFKSGKCLFISLVIFFSILFLFKRLLFFNWTPTCSCLSRFTARTDFISSYLLSKCLARLADCGSTGLFALILFNSSP